MKNAILYSIIFLFAIEMTGQGIVVQAEQIDVQVVNQDAVMLISSFGEPMNALDVSEDVIVVGGFYPAALFDTTAPSGLQYPEPIEGLDSWPNPARSAVIISTTNSDHEEYHVRLFDGSGTEILSEVWISGTEKLEIPLATFASGTYVIDVSDKESQKRSVLKVIKH